MNAYLSSVLRRRKPGSSESRQADWLLVLLMEPLGAAEEPLDEKAEGDRKKNKRGTLLFPNSSALTL